MSGKNNQPSTADFIGFSEDRTPQKAKFTPANYSSPQSNTNQPYFHNNRQWSNQKFNNSNNYQPYNNYNNSNSYNHRYSNSPNRSYNGGPNRSFNQSHNSSFNQTHNSSFNQSPNSSFNRNQNRSFNNSGHYKAKQDHNNIYNKNLYLHPSFMEDPWAELEAKLKSKQLTSEASNDTTGNVSE